MVKKCLMHYPNYKTPDDPYSNAPRWYSNNHMKRMDPAQNGLSLEGRSVSHGVSPILVQKRCIGPTSRISIPPAISHLRLNSIKLLKGIPELVTPLPERGNGRNHDLVLSGITDHETVTICIEAKYPKPRSWFD